MLTLSPVPKKTLFQARMLVFEGEVFAKRRYLCDRGILLFVLFLLTIIVQSVPLAAHAFP